MWIDVLYDCTSVNCIPQSPVCGMAMDPDMTLAAAQALQHSGSR